MKKITLLIVTLLLSFLGFSQGLPLEGFENTAGPDLPPPTTPSTWTIGTGEWAVFDNGVGQAKRWEIRTAPAEVYSGINSAYMDREFIGLGNTSEDYLATPLITVPANGQLRFFTRSTIAQETATLFQIKIALATGTQINPSDYTLLQQYTEATLTTTYNVYEEKVINIPPQFIGQQIYIAFVMRFTQNVPGLSGDRWLIDNVKVVERCIDPTTPTVANITQTSAELSWANPGGATSWEIEIVPVGTLPTGTGIVYNGALPYLATTTATGTPLTPTTSYNYYVRAICANSLSNYVGPTAFTTSSPGLSCLAPITITTLPYSTTDTTANYADSTDVTQPFACANTGTNYMTGNDVFYSYTPTTSGLISITMTPSANWSGIFVYQGCANVGVTCVAGVANNGGGVRVIPNLAVTAGLPYIIVISTNATPQTVAYTLVIQPVTCAQPDNLTAPVVLQTSAQLSWGNPGSATSWQVAVQPAGGAIPSGAGITTTINTNYPVASPLTPDTGYQYWVRADCGNGTFSAWAGPFLFTTPSIPPQCGGTFTDPGGATANYANGANVTTIICPNNTNDQVTVTFTSFALENNFDFLRIYDGSNTANLLATYTGATLPASITSSATGGCLTFVFTSDGSVTAAGFIANITCDPAPTCPKPTVLTTPVATITSTSVVVGWTNNSTATSFQVLALPCASPAPTALTPLTAGFTTSSNPFTYTGLTADTCYNFYVRAICSSTDISFWSDPKSATTLQTPPACGGIFTDNGGANVNYTNGANVITTICPGVGEIVTVTFTSFQTETNWDGLYVFDGNSINAPQISSGNGPTNIGGSLPGSFWGNTIPGPFESSTAGPNGCLTFQFISDGSVNNPGWIANVTCAPVPTCPKPTLLTATVTQNSATLGWTENGSATAWEVFVVPFGSAPPVAGSLGIATTNPYTFNNLPPGTAYTFYVRSLCGPNDISFWSAAYSFGTLPLNDECANATLAIVNQNLNCVQTVAGTITGATASQSPPPPTPPVLVCPGTPNDDVWFTFTATAITHFISFNNVTPATVLNYGIFQGSCGNLIQVGCNIGTGLIPGNTYYIRVYSTLATPQFTNFNLCIGTLPCAEAPAFCTGQTVTYQNSTNIPSLGTIGCLGSSPNPAFFFLQVNQAGPLSYLISQVDTGGTPRDVDYVAWGPFDDLTQACGAVPSFPIAGLQPPLTPAQGCSGQLHGCSFSIAPTEILCIPQATICKVYVIMITNFSNLAGTVTFTQTNTGGGTTECFPINTFNYPLNSYCQDGVDPIPVLANGASAGTYTSTTGLSINPTTGVIDLSASTPGAYVVTSTTLTSTNGACTNIPSITTSRTVIITAPASATFTYSQASFCNGITSQQPSNLVGTVGGTYAATPAGLSILFNNGSINPSASAVGNYLVTYTVAATGGCAAFTTTANVEIIASPVILQPANVTACNSYTMPTLPVGNYFSQPNGQGTQYPAGTVITASQIMHIYAQNSLCSNEKSFTMTINTIADPVVSVITQPTCQTQTGTIQVTSPVDGGVLPSNLFISEVTDADAGSLTYVEIYNGTGASVNLSNYKLKTYNNGNTTVSPGCDNNLTGTLANNATYVVKLSLSPNQPSITPNATFTSCGAVNIDDNIRLTNLSDVVIDLWGRTDGLVFTPAGQTGYVYRRNINASVPNTTFIATDWTTLDPEVYTNVGTYVYTTSNFQYNVDGGTYQSSPTFSGLTPGNHSVTVQNLITNCISNPVTVTINAVPLLTSVTTFSYTTPVCQASTINPFPNTSATGFSTGGTFTSTTGLSINSSTGEINLALSLPGNYAITYSVLQDLSICQSAGSTTASIDLTIPATPVTTFSYTTPVCQLNSINPLPNTTATGFNTSGTFTSTSGLSLNSTTGEINLATSTAGPYVVTYTVPAIINNCQLVGTSTANIVITPATIPVTLFSYTTPVCANGTNPSPIPATGFTTGGVYSSTTGLSINSATGVINLASSTAGTYSVTYTIAQNLATCLAAGSSNTTIIINPVITPITNFSYVTPACADGANESPIFGTGFTSGGTFSSTTGLSINASTGIIDVVSSTPGTYTITYSVSSNASICQIAASETAVLFIENDVLTSVSGECVGPNYVLTSTPLNNSYNPTGVNVTYSWTFGTSILGSSQTQTVTQAGNYSVKVTSNGCDAIANFIVDGISCSIQKGISPNNDQLNDSFDLSGLNVKMLSIFNRYGTKVYSKSNYINEWFGQSNKNEELPDGTYYYVIESDDIQTKSGWIYINRQIK
ncbi:fibronectin type III domain-containing protein [Flavobacterium sp.]|uniref:fibronectin type III domain-containing protein n=1 Tax=Flavobacterium sp. TaxID=239 RepID=UPI003753AF97